MSTDATNLKTVLRHTIRGLEFKVEAVEKLFAAGAELPDITDEINDLQNLVLQLRLLQHAQHSRSRP